MVKGVGTDIVDVARISAVLSRQGDAFVTRVLAVSEQPAYHTSQQKPSFMAKRFAAKEAVAKALGTGIGNGVSFQDIVISHDTFGAPMVSLSGGAQTVMSQLGATRVFLSIADEKDYALAFATITA